MFSFIFNKKTKLCRHDNNRYLTIVNKKKLFLRSLDNSLFTRKGVAGYPGITNEKARHLQINNTAIFILYFVSNLST
jgi:hypothetical protein